jgi:thiamine monophosphate synthase
MLLDFSLHVHFRAAAADLMGVGMVLETLLKPGASSSGMKRADEVVTLNPLGRSPSK